VIPDRLQMNPSTSVIRQNLRRYLLQMTSSKCVALDQHVSVGGALGRMLIVGAHLTSCTVCTVIAEETPRPDSPRFLHTLEAITIDGRLDEATWSEAIPAARFFEVYPADIGVPTVRTEARFLFDKGHVYVGVRSESRDSGAMASALVRRDHVLEDQEYVEVLIDPINGRRNALLFRTNAHSVTTDGQFNESTQLVDYTVDLNFSVSTAINDVGWTAEFKIPLSTLRYHSGRNQSWTILIRRNLPYGNTVTLASAPISRTANCTLCFAQQVDGLSLESKHAPLTFVPYAALAYRTAQDGAARSETNRGNIGFDAKWQPTPNTVIDLTVSPDFSQVEADDLQLTANTRFALAVAEKRPFFLESADLLSSPTSISAIHTRSFTAPDGGVRVTRRGHGFDYSTFLLRDAGGGSIIEPGASASQFAPQDSPSTAFVGRYTLHSRSVTWGGLATARLNDDGSHNLVLGADSVWEAGPADRIVAQIVGSETRNPDSPEKLPSWMGQRIGGVAGSLAWTHSDSFWYSGVSYLSYSHGFRAWNGFVPQVGVTSISGRAGLNFYPRSSWVIRMSPGVLAYHIKELNGRDLGQYVAPTFTVEGPASTTLSIYWYPHYQDITGAGLRTYSYWYSSLTTTPFRWTPQVTIAGALGEGVDVSTGNTGRSRTLQAVIPIRLHRIEVRPGISYQSLDTHRTGATSWSRLKETNVQIDALWHFSSTLYAQALYQRSKFRMELASPSASTAVRSTDSLHSLLLSYRPGWQTRYYVGIRRGDSRFDADSPAAAARTEVFVKFAREFAR
jgi:hypothetical protein